MLLVTFMQGCSDALHGYLPATAMRTAQSPADTPCMSPSGPIHIVAATGRAVLAATSTAHSISSTCSKYCSIPRHHVTYIENIISEYSEQSKYNSQRKIVNTVSYSLVFNPSISL